MVPKIILQKHNTKENNMWDNFYTRGVRKKRFYEREHLLVMQKKNIYDTKENKRGVIRKKIF